MFYQCLMRVETHEKCDETRVLSFPFLARPSQGPATWLANSGIMTMFTKPSALYGGPEGSLMQIKNVAAN